MRLPVTTGGAAAFTARFACGALGLFGTPRMAAGHNNGLGYEAQGSRGSLRFDLERLNEMQMHFAQERNGTDGFRTVLATSPEHPYASACCLRAVG